MKILFENYHYEKYPFEGENCQSLEEVLAEGKINAKHVESDTKLSIDYVGYFYSRSLNDCVFILPNVLMDENGMVLGKVASYENGEGPDGYDPTRFLQIDQQEALGIEKDMLVFVYEFSLWVYRAIDVYRHRNPDSDIAVNSEITQMGRGKRRDRYTFVDVVLALLDFNKKNQDYLTFVLRNIHSGNNKINWTKTIAQNRVIVQEDAPLYYHPVNKKKQINYDEELLIIYYSILYHINQKYNFPVHINANFDLITGRRFEQYIKGTGKRRLKQIKYKYFSDRDLEIWNLCYAFFDFSYKVAILCDKNDYLLIHDFHSVFEDMVDDLLSEKGEEVCKMKVQEDNKRLDHLYRYPGLTKLDKDVYYIGDSKYYNRGHQITKDSVAKQYTYARNLVQYNLDLFNSDNEKDRKKALIYRDGETEGYDIVPNFFISAKIDDISSAGYHDSKIELIPTPEGDRFYISYHFKNRLFDRDTILVAHYNVNFLFVLALYAKNRPMEQHGWSDKVKAKFRKEIIDGLNEEFQFYVMSAHEDVDTGNYITENFQSILGKVFLPFDEKDNQKYFSLALRKPESIHFKDKEKEEEMKAEIQEENEALLFQLKQSFYVVPCLLGELPYDKLPCVTPNPRVAVPQNFLTMHHLENYPETSFLIGIVNDEAHLQWIYSREGGKRDDAYNVRIGKNVPGGVVKNREEIKHAKFVILYMAGKEQEGVYKAFRVKNIGEMTKEHMIKTGYKDPHYDKYLCYFFDEEVTIGNIDIKKIIEDDKKAYFDTKNSKSADDEYPIGRPIYLNGAKLVEYRID